VKEENSGDLSWKMAFYLDAWACVGHCFIFFCFLRTCDVILVLHKFLEADFPPSNIFTPALYVVVWEQGLSFINVVCGFFGRSAKPPVTPGNRNQK